MLDAVADHHPLERIPVSGNWHEIDEVYARLKQHDAEWLSATLRSRLSEVLNYSLDHEGLAKESAQDPPEYLPSPETEQEPEYLAQTLPQAQAPPRRPLLERLKKRRHHGREEAHHISSRSHRKQLWAHDLTSPGLPADKKVSDHVRWIRAFDWASTELGAMATWSPELRRMVNVCLTDPRPATLWWGRNRVMLYNEAYKSIAGAKHPRVLGKPIAQAWPEAMGSEGAIAQSFAKGEKTGEPSMGENALFPNLLRNGFLEDIYASWAIYPVPAENGESGFYNIAYETTKQVLTDRRMSTLLYLGHCTSTATNTSEFWTQILKGLEANLHDCPFGALYAAVQNDSNERPSIVDISETSSITSPSPSDRGSVYGVTAWSLEGTLCHSRDENVLPTRIDNDQAATVLTPAFRKAIKSGQVTLLRVSDGTFPKALQRAAKSRSTGDLCEAAVLCPVGPTNRENVLGFMLIGINPRFAFDTEYEQFIQLLTRQVSTSMASMVLIEDELRRSRIAAELAAQDRIRLAEQLAESKAETLDSDTRFRRMADLAPVSMFHMSGEGEMLYANDNWFELTQYPRNETFYPLSWYTVILEADHSVMDTQWAKLMAGEPVNFELRLKKAFVAEEVHDGERVEGNTWIIAAAYVEKKPDGSVRSILGCLTDISKQKWMEGLQERRMKEAMELKRQQENFMDMTSHEARNPLAAITLCAESIVTTFKELLADARDPVTLSKDTIQTHLEGADTIMACAIHQKRIIDDVLTLSKLDSGLLAITPIEVQPAETIGQALKMFEAEFQKADVELQFDIEDSYRALDIQWVRMDPSRVLQILINLITNAIKFTQTQSIRHVKVSLSASTEKPTTVTQGVEYLTDQLIPREPWTNSEAEQPVFVAVSVKDTGKGISMDEMSRLFQRFQQASPKTHVKYGGSGLGLFISRELARLQGGQIGVTSEAGVGSTFAFYVPAARCPPPPQKAQRKESHASLREKGHTRQSSVGSGPGVALKVPHLQLADDVASLTLEEAGESTPAIQHLLVVEDNLVNQKVMVKQLVRAGYNVSVANHGIEALDHIRKSCHCQRDGEPLDLILMDVEMPVMDGLTCARHLRSMEDEDEINTHIPVIAVTANARAEQQQAALEAGMDAVVTKPFRMGELLPELERVGSMNARSP